MLWGTRSSGRLSGSPAPFGQEPAASKSTGKLSESSRSIISTGASSEVVFESQEMSSRFKKKKKLKKSCLAFGKLSNPQMPSWIHFLQQCGLSYVKHFLPAIAEGGSLELEMSFPKSLSRLGASSAENFGALGFYFHVQEATFCLWMRESSHIQGSF